MNTELYIIAYLFTQIVMTSTSEIVYTVERECKVFRSGE